MAQEWSMAARMAWTITPPMRHSDNLSIRHTLVSMMLSTRCGNALPSFMVWAPVGLFPWSINALAVPKNLCKKLAYWTHHINDVLHSLVQPQVTSIGRTLDRRKPHLLKNFPHKPLQAKRKEISDWNLCYPLFLKKKNKKKIAARGLSISILQTFTCWSRRTFEKRRDLVWTSAMRHQTSALENHIWAGEAHSAHEKLQLGACTCINNYYHVDWLEQVFVLTDNGEEKLVQG